MKRGYLVTGADRAWGVAIVAHSAREAKRTAWKDYEYELNCEWCDLTVSWRQKADVSAMPYGIVDNEDVASGCGLIDYRVR